MAHLSDSLLMVKHSGEFSLIIPFWDQLLFQKLYIYIYIYHHHHHHHVVPLAGISLTLSRHFSLSFIASGRSSGLHPVSLHSCCMYVPAGRPAFARPLPCFIQLCVPIFLLWYKLSKTFKIYKKKQTKKNKQTSTPYTSKQPLMMAYEGSESARDNSSTNSNLKLRHLSENLKGS